MSLASQERLIVAVPKGRVLKQLGPGLAQLGFTAEDLAPDSRKLQLDGQGADPISLLLVKPDDVPTYVGYGAAHMGIVGRDILGERDDDVLLAGDLDIGRCRLAVAGTPAGRKAYDAHGPLRVATKFVRAARRHFEGLGRRVEVIYVQGSVELAPLTGLSDVIVDLVESGQTLKDNGLVEYETIADINSVLIANRRAFKMQHEAITTIATALTA